MGQAFVGEIKMFAGTFAPFGYADCNGQLMSIAQNTALFALIGTTYGGDGQNTFALPDLRGRGPIHQGEGGGLSPYIIGEQTGTENVTLIQQQIPAHNHAPATSASNGNQASPANGVFAPSGAGQFAAGPPNAQMAGNLVGIAGGNQPHDNMMPFLTIRFIIALFGIFPSRS